MSITLPRAIVRDAAILDGRWHIAGTRIAIAEIVLQFQASGTARADGYLYPRLTAAETHSAIAFEFPAIRQVATSVQLAAVTVHCECGEDIHQTLTGWPELDIACICGRVWDVGLQVTLSHRASWRISSPDSVPGPDGNGHSATR